jgi:hypothetical protein
MRHELCAIPVRVGTRSQLAQAPTAAVAAPVEEARAYEHAQAVAPREETRGRPGAKPAWFWVAVTMWVRVCVVRLSRGGPSARELLGATFAGMLVTERDSADNWYPVRWRPLCGAHLFRDFAAMGDRGGHSKAIGEA